MARTWLENTSRSFQYQSDIMREFSRVIVVLTVLPIFMALVAVLTASRWYVLSILFPLIIIVIALALSGKPTINITLSLDNDVMYVNDELNIKLKVSVHGGFGLLLIRAPPMPDTSMSEAFELIRGNNVHIVFKGFRNVNREYQYTLRALRRGKYMLDRVEYTYYNALGIHEPVKYSLSISKEIQVLPRVKIVRRAIGVVRPRQGVPRYPPSRLGPYSTEFRSVRNYVYGDSFKFINWKATARSPGNRLMVNEYEREGLRTAIIVLDLGWWMRYGTAEENPLEYGISLILSLSRVLLRYGYNVGLWVIPAGPSVMPTSGISQYYRLLSTLMMVRSLPLKGYVMPVSLTRIINETRPATILITNITKENVEKLSELMRQLPTKALIIDISPNTILMKNLLQKVPCGQWLIRDKRRLYAVLPQSVKIITWDPACEGIGMVMARVLSYIGRWL
ncbi:MAG: DUF58 domain-containing protein [Vulcanisaeta sp.]